MQSHTKSCHLILELRSVISMLASVAILIRVQQYNPEHKNLLKRALNLDTSSWSYEQLFFQAGLGSNPDSG